MGRKKTTRTETVEDEADNEGSTLLETGIDDATIDAGMAALDELRSLGGDDVFYWTVFKVPGKPGEKGGYCARYSSGELNLDTIRDTFGGGKYRIRGSDQSNKFVAGTSRTIEVIDLPKPPQPVAQAAPQFDGLAQILAAVKPSGDGTGDLLKMMIAMMDNNAKMFAALMENRRDSGSNLNDTLQLINAMKEKSGGAAEVVSMLLKGIELGKDMGGGGGETGLMDIAAKGLDMIQPLIAAQANAPKPAPRAKPAMTLPPGAPPAAPAANGAAAPAAPVPPKEINPMLQKLNWLRQQVRVLVYQASRDSDPALYAAVMLDNLPDYISEDELYERISAEDALTQLAALDANVNVHRAWFDAFRTALLEQLSEESGGDDEPPGGAIEGEAEEVQP